MMWFESLYSPIIKDKLAMWTWYWAAATTLFTTGIHLQPIPMSLLLRAATTTGSSNISATPHHPQGRRLRAAGCAQRGAAADFPGRRGLGPVLIDRLRGGLLLAGLGGSRRYNMDGPHQHTDSDMLVRLLAWPPRCLPIACATSVISISWSTPPATRPSTMPTTWLTSALRFSEIYAFFKHQLLVMAIRTLPRRLR